MCASCRRCRASPASCKATDWQFRQGLILRLRGCLLATCLLKTVFCCVRVSNHVPGRRVALRAPRAARRGTGAGVDRLCRLQRRHVDAAFAKFLVQSLYLASGSHRSGPTRHGRAPRTSTIFPSAIATVLGTADCGAAILSDGRRVGGTARLGLLFAARPSP